MMTFNGKTANEVWTKAYKTLTKTSFSKLQKSRSGVTKELLHVAFTISNPRERWVTVRNPAINPAFALSELFWILNGSNKSSIINSWNPLLPKYAGFSKQYNGAYGFRLRKHFKIDQILRAYSVLKNNPDSRQVVMQIWDPYCDLPSNNGEPVDEDIPCNICSLVKIRDNKLEWLQIVRSNDIFRGLPYNVVQFTSIQEIMAGWLGIEPGTYHQISDSLHLYERDEKILNLGKPTNIGNVDRLGLPKEKYDIASAAIFENMCSLTSQYMHKKDFIRLLKTPMINNSYNNIMVMIAADIAHRRKWYDIESNLISECTNPLYKLLWYSWIARKKEREIKKGI